MNRYYSHAGSTFSCRRLASSFGAQVCISSTLREKRVKLNPLVLSPKRTQLFLLSETCDGDARGDGGDRRRRSDGRARGGGGVDGVGHVDAALTRRKRGVVLQVEATCAVIPLAVFARRGLASPLGGVTGARTNIALKATLSASACALAAVKDVMVPSARSDVRHRPPASPQFVAALHAA